MKKELKRIQQKKELDKERRQSRQQLEEKIMTHL